MKQFILLLLIPVSLYTVDDSQKLKTLSKEIEKLQAQHRAILQKKQPSLQNNDTNSQTCCSKGRSKCCDIADRCCSNCLCCCFSCCLAQEAMNSFI
jgi:hypothetical protein